MQKVFRVLFAFILSVSALVSFQQPVSAYEVKDGNSTVGGGAYATQSIWYSNRMSASTFNATSGYYAGAVNLYLRRVGNPTGGYRIGIKATTNGIPTGDYLGYADYENMSFLYTSWAWLMVEFLDDSPLIINGMQYAVIIEPISAGSDSSNYVDWRASFQSEQPFIGQTLYDTSIDTQWVTNVYEVSTQDQIFTVLSTDTPIEDEGSIYCSEAFTRQALSGNFSASFFVYLNPAGWSGNVTAVMSKDVDLSQAINGDNWFTNPINLTKRSIGSENATFEFMTNPYLGGVTIPPSGELLPNTTYYYQARAEVDATTTYSDIYWFMTTESGLPIKPLVKVISIKDMSDSNNPYTFEITAQIVSNNSTLNVINQGFWLSLNKSVGGDGLAPTVYSYNVNNVAPDNTFSLLFTLNSLSSYGGGNFYIQAFIYVDYYGQLFSSVVTYKPTGLLPNVHEGTTITTIDEVVNNIKEGLGLTGTMGAWAFLGLILLIIALIFGTATFSLPENLRKPMAIIWTLISIAVVGAFIFTGQLGIWPVLILVGGVVALVMIIASMRLSGGTI